MKGFRLSLFHSLWPAIALLAGLIVAMSMTSAQALPAAPAATTDTPGGIEGHLYEPSTVTLVPVYEG